MYDYDNPEREAFPFFYLYYTFARTKAVSHDFSRAYPIFTLIGELFWPSYQKCNLID